MRTFLICASLLALASACGNDNGGALPDGGGNNDGMTGCSVDLNFSSLHANLLATTRCAIAGCHAASSSQGGLNFEAGKQAVYDELLTGGTFNSLASGMFPNRIVAGDSANSYLYVKVSQTNPIGGGSGRMPPGLPLDDCQIQVIQQWIDEGAPND